jgi:hypothetical protein
MKIYVISFTDSVTSNHHIVAAFNDEKAARLETDLANKDYKKQWIRDRLNVFYEGKEPTSEERSLKYYEFEHAYNFNYLEPYQYQETLLYSLDQ